MAITLWILNSVLYVVGVMLFSQWEITKVGGLNRKWFSLVKVICVFLWPVLPVVYLIGLPFGASSITKSQP